MKKSYWLALGTAFSMNLVDLMAQTATPPAAPVSDPASAPMTTPTVTAAGPSTTNATSTRSSTRRAGAGQSNATRPRTTAARTPATNATPVEAAAPKLVNLVRGPASITGSNINVRGQANLAGEVICRLNQGDYVTVIESIVVEKPKKGEPAQWARISFPTNAHVWVFSNYIDPTNKTVSVAKLNLRGGPGENYSVVGTLKRGDSVNEIITREQWTQIAPPTNAYAFVAAEFVKQESIPAAIPTPPSNVTIAVPPPVTPETNAAPAIPALEMPLQTNAIAAVPPVAPTLEPTNPPAIQTNTIVQASPTADVTPTPIAATTTSTFQPMPALEVPNEMPPATTPLPLEFELLPKRIVQREGIVRNTWSIQAPSSVELANPDTGATMDYLYSPSPQVNLKRYRGLRVLVTGEEGLDKRWKNTPVLIIQKIQVVD